MKKSKMFTFLFVLSMFFGMLGMSSITAKAQHEFSITDVTKSSISFDWSNVANEWLREEYASTHEAKFRDFTITVSEYDSASASYKAYGTYTSPYNKYNYTLNGLKPSTEYKFEISLYMDYNGGRGGGRTWRIWDETYTASAKPYTMKVVNRTKTSLKVDTTDAIEAIKTKVTSAGGTGFSFSEVSFACVKQTGTAEAALRKARMQTIKAGYTYKRDKAKEYTGLTENTTYAFVAKVRYSYKNSGGKYVSVQEYIETGDVKTASASDDNKPKEDEKNPAPKEDQKQPVVDNNPATGNGQAAVNQDPAKAHISINKDKLKASKLKKKAKTLTIKVDNSKGKIKVKNVSAKKLRKYAKTKIKKGKVLVTFKKGAPKGTYKFDVTVAASGNIKKTTETVTVVVK